jgi:hypothetical protein
VPPADGPRGKQNEQEDEQPAVNDTTRNQTSTDLPEEDVEVVIQYYERSKKKTSAGKKRGEGAEASGGHTCSLSFFFYLSIYLCLESEFTGSAAYW